jgi:CheY-like chemotaxis protein
MDEKPQVIVVDDDADIRYLAQKKLEAAGYQTIPAENGLEALQRMIDHPRCRRMVTDYVMPTLGGEYWIRMLERFCADWTIVVVSSEDIDSGSLIIVPKPADYENILHVFERASR